MLKNISAPFFINAPSKERIIFNDPRRQLKKYNGSSREIGQTKETETTARESEHSVERAKNLKMNKSIEEHIPRKQNHEATMGPQHLAIRRIRYPQLMEQRAALALVRPSADSAMVWPRGHRRRLWPIFTTNTTKELIPANIDQKWTDGKEQMGEQWQGTHRIRSGNVGKNWHNLDQMNYSFLDTENIGQQKQNPLTIRALSPNNELRIKKLSRISNENGIRTKLDVKHLTTTEESGEKEFLSMSGSASGAGGSFASSEPFEEVGQTLPTLPTVRPKILPQILTHPLQKAPQFKFLSLLERSAEEAAVGQQIQSGTALGASSSAVENRPKLGHRLMECCQQQAPGCRAICRRDVNKEEVKKVMVSGQCPPVTMTGVIQCFPRFFNISSVGKCCAQQRTKIGESDANNSLLLQQTKAQTLPLQCLSLCAPNFHLTFAHLACVDHIEHILDCYRHLLEDNAQNNDQFQQHQQPIMFPLSSSSPFS